MECMIDAASASLSELPSSSRFSSVAYELLMQARRPKGEVPAGGRFAQVRLLLRKARQVALIYVVVIVISGILRISGWIE